MSMLFNKEKSTSRVLKTAVIAGIVIVINLFFSTAVSLVYPEPQYDAFCPSEALSMASQSQETCAAVGGYWMATDDSGYCDTASATCQKDYDAAHSAYARTVFVISVIGGVALLIGATFLARSTTIASGASFAGVLMLFIGSVQYWDAMSDIVRVVVLGVALAALLTLAYKKFED